MFVIETIDIVDVYKYNIVNCNHDSMCNKKVFEANWTEKWIKKFYKTYKIIYIPYIEWLKDATLSNMQTKCFNMLYVDHLNDYLEKNPNTEFDGKPYHVRTEKFLLNGPFYTIKDTIKELTTIDNSDNPLISGHTTLYMLPYIHIEPWEKFIVFVYKKTIVAISQKHVYTTFYELNVDSLKMYSKIIYNYFYYCVRSNITHILSYTFNVGIKDEQPYFIEMGSYGKEYANDSGLFNWSLDSDILYNDSVNEIVVRWTRPYGQK